MQSKKLGLWVILVGIISIAMGVFFIAQGFNKSDMITEAMASQNITYNSAGGEIVGVIDNAYEAKVMSDVLASHRSAQGSYTALKKDDPKRQTILNAMTMENALNLAQMGLGLTQVVEGTGAFMILIGLTMGALGVSGLRAKKQV